MSGGLEQLEQRVERELALLGSLPAVTLDPACRARVTAAALAEAKRLGRRRYGLARVGGGVAAALLLAAGWTFLVPGGAAARPEAEVVLRDWARAWDESSRSVGDLLAGGWVATEFGAEPEGANVDELFNVLDQSLDRFGAL